MSNEVGTLPWRRAALSAWPTCLPRGAMAVLADAAMHRDAAAVRTLLGQNVDVNAPQADGARRLALGRTLGRSGDGRPVDSRRR